MLQRGSTGSAVVALQKKLGITADGIFGPATEAAVRRYQAAHGLSVDGIVGPNTSRAMGLSGGSTGSSGSSSPTGAKAAAQDWSTTAEGQATSFGWSLSVINSSPELKTLFDKATSQNWTSDRFVAAVRDTSWFKTHSDSARQALILQKADPATYNQRVTSYANEVMALGRTLGVNMTSAEIRQVSSEALMYGWGTDDLKLHLAAFVKTQPNGSYTGSAATDQLKFQQMAGQYGVAVSPQLMATWVRNAATGIANEDTVRQYMVNQAASRYPALAERLHAGETLQQIADPYVQSYAQVLETNPNAIKLSDPLIQQALATKDKDGKPATKTVWQFEQDLRQDPRYMQTKQAQDKAMSLGRRILSDFGLLGS